MDPSSMDGMDVPEVALDCFGDPIPDRQGNWIGHVFPGSIFIAWGIHWLIGIFLRYLQSRKSGSPYTSQTTEHMFPFLPPCLRIGQRVPFESILKAIFGFLLFWLQVYYGGYKTLVCPAGELRAGHVVTQHLNSWAHAAMNLGFMVSGIVELCSLAQELPHGTTQGVLSLALFLEYLLMGLHEKHGSLDSMLHKLLAYTMLGGSFFAGLEAAYPHSMALSAARSAALILQGTWFCQSAGVLFGGHAFYEDQYVLLGRGRVSDMGPAMFLPVLFCLHIVFVVLGTFVLFMAMALLHGRVPPAAAHAPYAAVPNGYSDPHAALEPGEKSSLLHGHDSEGGALLNGGSGGGAAGSYSQTAQYGSYGHGGSRGRQAIALQPVSLGGA